MNAPLLVALALLCAAAPPKKAPEEDWARLSGTSDKPAAAKAVRGAVARQVQYVAGLKPELGALEGRVRAGEASEDLLRAVMDLAHRCGTAAEQLATALAAFGDMPSELPDVASGAKEAAAGSEQAQALAVAALALADQLSSKVEIAGPPPTTAEQAKPTDDDLVLVSLGPAAEKAARVLAGTLAPLRSRKLVVAQVSSIETGERPEPPEIRRRTWDPKDLRGRSFSLALYQELSKSRFQAFAVADPAPFLGGEAPDIGGKPARDFVLVYGAIAVQPHQHIAWSLRAVDLGTGRVVAETEDVVRAEKHPQKR